MKKTFALIFACTLVLSFCVGAHADLSDGLVVHLALDGNAVDSSVNGNDGSESGGHSYVSGRVGPAISLNGTDASVSIPENTNLDGFGRFSVSLWIKPREELNAGSGRQDLLYKGVSDSVNQSYTLSYDAGGTGLRFIAKNGQSTYREARYVSDFTADEWVHILCTYDGTIPSAQMYVNGVAVGTEIDMGLTGAVADSGDALTVGMRPDNNYHFDGCIDDLRVYNRILTPAEISQLSNPTDSGVHLAPYFDLTIGRTLAYLDFDPDGGGGLVPDEVFLETVISLGGDLIAEAGLYPPAWSPNGLDIWEVRPDGHYRVGEYDFDSGELEPLDEPVGPVDGTMEVGETVSHEYWLLVGGTPEGPMRTEITLVAAGFPYSTYAGSFTDCVLMILDHFRNDIFTSRTYWVLARGVGPLLELDLDDTGTPQDLNLLVVDY